MSGFGYDVLGFGSGGVAGPETDDDFNRTSFLSHFDGANNGVNNAFDDGSASNHGCTAAGTATQGSFGPFARPEGHWGVEFDGNDGIKTPAASVTNFGTGDFTMEAFFNSNVVDTSIDIIIQNWGGGTGNPPALMVNRGAVGDVQFYIGASLILDSGANAFVANTWNHVAIARSGTSLKMFVNGSVKVTATNNANITVGNTNVAVGYDVQNTDYYFNGSLSNVRIVKGTAVYTSAFTPPTAPLTAITNTQLLTCQSNNFVDNSASARTLTVAGNPEVSAFGPFLTDAAYDPAVNGASVYFDASASTEIIIADDLTDFHFGTGAFTVECWVYRPGTGGGAAIFTTHRLGVNTGYYLRLGAKSDGESVSWGSYGNGNGNAQDDATATFSDNQWLHVAVVRTNTNTNGFKIYINGVAHGTFTDVSNYATTPYAPRVGSYESGGNPNNIKAYISDLRIVKGTAVYTGNFTPPTAPLTAITNTKLLLNMKDGQIIDNVAQNNMTLYGGAKLSTGQAKFGDTSMLMSSNGDYAASTESLTLGSGNFTVELFLRLTGSPSTGAYAVVFDNRPIQTVGAYLEIGLNDSRQLLIKQNNSAIIAASSATLLAIGQWYHIAYVRNGTTGTLYVNGTSVGSATDSLAYITGTLMWGKHAYSTDVLPGYFDEARVSKTARYTGNFTAPTEPFADQGQV